MESLRLKPEALVC